MDKRPYRQKTLVDERPNGQKTEWTKDLMSKRPKNKRPKNKRPNGLMTYWATDLMDKRPNVLKKYFS